ncbi:dihydrodipicolinate synthase family protein [Lipingzhangella sp. LS1_29]|uniref:Dihydrodipicolinate synthase family protein n=1 Tax=Lipingzhangella rawalii TaxID=2055835 RepID=A0ABU2H2E4_9ACTN|nr:dihydrodipicolinate synthase family protein [Lipingzhangella rawalii]MDS1269034.1 dihydrodipicolinate synthase family protein [Lipingzhangella rawalii]
MALFHGLSAFPITPTDEHGRVDTAAVGALTDRLATAGVDSVGVLGSTGIAPYLERGQRRRAVAAAVDATAGRTPVMAGVAALRTDTAIDLARDAAAAGADGLLAPVMAYAPLSDTEIHTHIAAVARATDLPLAIYNNPVATHLTISTELTGRLAQIPTVCAVKHPGPPAEEVADNLAALRAHVPSDFAVGYSGDHRATAALLAGADGWYSVSGGLFPEAALAIVRAAQAGDAASAHASNERLAPVWELFAELSSLRVMYCAANLLGITEAQPPRPVLPLPKADRDRVAAALELARQPVGTV